jgi:hypothetical protein
MVCDRCGKETSVFTMSYFNTDSICIDCQELEQRHPDYKRAKEKENEQVRAGNYNFDGVGLPDGFREWAKSYE